ncbi:unnamed protein product [Lactuca virosa]|uniref:Uncharacterized protein n=1 Tax=Lactuca virosa TaxID=75947 RepID=A0AAU9NXY3_9ASTR|nr:unnamed protein product [Lactuca virosa]
MIDYFVKKVKSDEITLKPIWGEIGTKNKNKIEQRSKVGYAVQCGVVEDDGSILTVNLYSGVLLLSNESRVTSLKPNPQPLSIGDYNLHPISDLRPPTSNLLDFLSSCTSDLHRPPHSSPQLG